MIGTLRSETNARTVVEPQTPSLWLLVWNLQPFPLPQSLDAFVVDLPTGLAKQSRDPTIPVAAVLPRQFDHVGNETLFVRTAAWNTPLRRPMLTEHATGPAFRYAKIFLNMIDTAAFAGRA